jgi:hypothetical protein
MMVEVPDTKLPVLSGRIMKGLDFCNSTWQKMRVANSDAEYHRLNECSAPGSYGCAN